jgi:hypothetical protein
MDNYKQPPYSLKDAREVLERLYKKEPSEEFLKEIEETQKYEDITCECPMTGTIEIMRRKI